MAARKRRAKAKGTYRFMDKDPQIGVFHSEAQRKFGGKVPYEAISVNSKGGVSGGTMRNWIEGGVRRPQNLTMRFAMEAIGIQIRLFRDDGTEIGLPSLKMPKQKNGRG